MAMWFSQLKQPNWKEGRVFVIYFIAFICWFMLNINIATLKVAYIINQYKTISIHNSVRNVHYTTKVEWSNI